MSLLHSTLEPFFMNQLPFSYREVARDFYLNESLDALLEMRLDRVTQNYQTEYGFCPAQWHEVINAVLLTRLSLIDLNALSQQELTVLDKIVKLVLEAQANHWQTLFTQLEQDAPRFYRWVVKLRKLLGNPL